METSTAKAVSHEESEAAVEVLWHFLVGRLKPYALQNQDGSYSVVRDYLTHNELRKHLAGDITVGTYTIDEDNLCRCVIWDIDSGNFGEVLRLVAVLPGPSAVYESGRKGWHVVQSFEPKLPASLAHAYGIDRKIAAGLPTIESFPKQPGIA